MKEYEIDCLKSENERLQKQNKELKEKKPNCFQWFVLGFTTAMFFAQIVILVVRTTMKL